ncbi:unnamed protein product [Polarella glacialis]|uniref:Phosphoribulokinase n=1 Tax=Polarella glacialis TaxID=89957 RepID=A0A813LMC2_POLGL|nr:unnamed protein product [Polarella glacialis]
MGSPATVNGTGLLAAGTMARSRASLVPAAAAAAAFLGLLGQLAFLAPSTPSLGRRSHSSVVRYFVHHGSCFMFEVRYSGGDSVPTGLVYPSPEEKVKTREADGITLFSTHAWKDDMKAILPATKKLDHAPVMIGVAADSGCGKSTFLRRVLGALGTDVKPGHTAIGDMLTVICLDDYHINDRAGRKATGQSALDARENDFALMGAQIEALKQGKAVYKPIYNHDTGFKDPPELIEPNKVFVVEGLHPIYDTKARSQLDMSLYIDIVNEVKFAWKVKRDVAERGWTEEQVQADIQKRLPDFAAYVDPQKADADVILRYEPSDQGLPYLKVKLIQKKGGPFPMITLKKELTLTGKDCQNHPDTTNKQYCN